MRSFDSSHNTLCSTDRQPLAESHRLTYLADLGAYVSPSVAMAMQRCLAIILRGCRKADRGGPLIPTVAAHYLKTGCTDTSFCGKGLMTKHFFFYLLSSHYIRHEGFFSSSALQYEGLFFAGQVLFFNGTTLGYI